MPSFNFFYRPATAAVASTRARGTRRRRAFLSARYQACGSRATRHDLQEWLVDALEAHGGSATIVQVCEHVWANHEGDLRAAGDLFFTWQYDIRWAATKLRKRGIVGPPDAAPSGTWILAPPQGTTL